MTLRTGNDMAAYDFVLASASERRRGLLLAAGYKFMVEVSDFDEGTAARDPDAGVYAETLALGKAMSVARKRPGDIVLGADTICQCDGEIIGKPRDKQDAERIARKLFSRPHKTITGIAIVRLHDNLKIVAHDVTVVYPKKMSDEQIAAHLTGGTWQGKAGAYAIQETGDEFVERLEGSLSNVVGLPMELLEKVLRLLLPSNKPT
jgi:septum formation protein